MKRPLLFMIVALAALTFAALPALSAPAQQDVRPLIAQPAQDAQVRDVVQIIGTATHPQFQRYELYYAPSPVPSDQSWTFIGDAHNNQQPLGLLGTWDSRSVPDGAYVLRVRVVRQDGNYVDSDARRVIVANTQAAATPTPAESPTPLPELPPTDSPAAESAPVVEQPTVIVEIPTIAPTPTIEGDAAPTVEGAGAEPTATRTVISASGSEGSGSEGEDATTSLANQLFGGNQLLDTARKAATYTAAAFLAVGLFFAVKGILVWLWYKIKP